MHSIVKDFRIINISHLIPNHYIYSITLLQLLFNLPYITKKPEALMPTLELSTFKK